MLKTIDWSNLFTNSWFTNPQSILLIMMAIIVLAGVITIEFLIYQYDDYRGIQSTIQDQRFWYNDTKNKEYLRTQHHWERELKKIDVY